MLEVGQECEMRRRDEAGEFWSVVRIVRISAEAPWVRYVKDPGNSFPVPWSELRPRPTPPLRTEGEG